MGILRRLKLAAVTLLAAVSIPALAVAQQADLIVHNANIHTVDEANSTAEAVAVRDGVIIAVGTNEAVLALAGEGTRSFDAGGNTVIPGLIDSHIHMLRLGHDLSKVQVRDLESIDQLLRRIEEAAASTPEGEWIVTASDWHESQLEEGRFPTRWEIDEVAPNHPVFIRRGGHNVVINSVAMRLAGIAEDAEDPEGGHYVRDDQGRITGWILERPAIQPVAALLPTPGAAENSQALRAAMAKLNEFGVTSVRDQHVDPGGVAAWHALDQAGEATLRGYLVLSIHPRRPAQVDQEQWGSAGISTGFGNSRVRIGGLKMTHDGGVETSLLTEEFANRPGFRGIQVTPIEKIEEMARWGCENGWRISVHTVGDQAIENVIGVFEKIDETCDINGKRWSLEHPYLLTDAMIERMRALGVVAHMQTGHNYTLGAGWVEFWGEERANRSIPNRRLIDAGLMPTGGTDAPVTPFNPFLAMWADVTRKTASAGVLGADQAVTPEEALRMHTIWAARGMFAEDERGSIEVGKQADFAVLTADPLAVPHDEIRDISATMTVVGGAVVFSRQ